MAIKRVSVRKNAPEENWPRSGSVFGLELSLELRLGDNYPGGGGNFTRTKKSMDIQIKNRTHAF